MLASGIVQVLKQDQCTKNSFMGVYARNEIPNGPISFTSCFVFNTKPRTHDGEHWLMIITDVATFLTNLAVTRLIMAYVVT